MAHSFIHIEHLYSAPSRKTTKRGPNFSGVKKNSLQTREQREK